MVILIVALGALIENGRAFVRRAQLHRVEILLVVATLGAGLVDDRILLGFLFGLVVIIDPIKLYEIIVRLNNMVFYTFA